MSDHPHFDVTAFHVVVRRELATVVRTPTFAVLLAGFAAITLGVAAIGGGVAGGFVPTVVDLLVPVEVLVPIVAFAFGYRALLGDRDRGELDVLSTYPLSRLTYVVGVFVGRAVPLLGGLLVALVPVAVLVATTGGHESQIYAAQSGIDSVVLYGRFVIVTGLFALVMLAAALAVSAVSSSGRGALALVAVLWLVLGLGADLGLAAALERGLVAPDWLVQALALGPNSAYRGLVLQTVVDAATTTSVTAAAPPVNCLALVAWTAGVLWLTVRASW